MLLYKNNKKYFAFAEEKLRELQELKEMTKIVISQRTASLKRCDRIMVLYHGELVGFDCHEELLKNCTVYKEIYESQNSKDGDYNG